MTWEWEIGDPVDDSNGGTMDAMNWGHGGDDDDDCGSGNYGGSGGYGGYAPRIDPEVRNRRNLGYKKNAYERKLKEAREATNDDYRIKYYGEALEYAKEYFKLSERLGITIEGMPDRDRLLSKSDVDWISQKHYDEFYKLHILSTDQRENLENLLKESGNAERITENEETRRQRSEEASRRYEINQTISLREDYFRCIEKANDYALKNQPHHALKQYRNAVRDYEQYYNRDYSKDSKESEMPAMRLTPDAIDNIMNLYIKSHPLLKSDKNNKRINAEILELLDGDWDGRLEEADSEVQKILHLKQLERQKRKEKVENIGADAIVGARIVADSIFKRFKR